MLPLLLRPEVPVVIGSQRIDDDGKVAKAEHFPAGQPRLLLGIQVGVELRRPDHEDDAVRGQGNQGKFGLPGAYDGLGWSSPRCANRR